jgi:hypothetical protein
MRTALNVARYYGIEQELEDSTDQAFERLKYNGYIKEM